jgi:UbiD family decarboxylase
MSNQNPGGVKTVASAVRAFDLRAWLEEARAAGQLREAEGADPHLEVGAIAQLNAQRGGPAILFDKLAGYPAGFRVLTGTMMNARTLGLTLGISGELDNTAVVNQVADKLQAVAAQAPDYPMEVVHTGPVMENQRIGAEVDLTIFPTPLWSELDGGPFIGTGTLQIHQDPESNWINLATYRVQLHGKALVGNYISPGHHGYGIRQKYWKQGKPCPVVMCFGSHPLFLLIGSSDVPAGVDELTWIGAAAGRRVPVIRGPVTGLPIPADAEIAIEGYAYPGEEKEEGPFGEFTGYYASGKKPEPVVQVKALYYRSNPILLGAPPSRPPHDFSYYYSVMRSAIIKDTLRKLGVPGVRSVWCSEAGGGRMFIVTSIQQQYAGHAEHVAGLAALCQAGGLMARYSIVVDEDIDPSNNDDVIWALSTRSDPARDIDILRQCWSNSLDTMISSEAKEKNQLWNSRALINACRPWDRLKNNDFPPVAEASPALRDATRKKWAKLLE